MQIVIPAAGMGKRLGRVTQTNTKCMVKVNDKTLIEHTLDAVVQHEINRIVIIVGYEKDKVKNFLGNQYKGVDILYVDNDLYATTNNIFSIFLAKDYLAEDDTLLIESDLIFDPELLRIILENKHKDLVMVDQFRSWMDGTVVKIDDDFSISHFIPKKDFQFSDADSYFKTLNIYKFSREFLETIYIPFLEAYSNALGRNEYYEQVLKVIVDLDTKHLKALPINGQKWYEIDDLQDLDIANIIFADKETKYDLLSARYGGYWRFDNLKDFCYLVNPYFPSIKMEDELKFNFSELIHHYPSSLKIQSMLAGKMFSISPENILVGNGAAELINGMTDAMDIKLGLFTPTFEEYTARLGQVETTFSEKDGFAYDKRDLINLAENKDGIILINPDNPSGNYINNKDILEILEYLQNTDKFLILDESFLDFAEDGFNSSFLNDKDLNKFTNLVVIKSIGKSYGVGGLRLGVMASGNISLIEKVSKKLPIWNINSISENYLQIISKYSKEYIQSCEKIISERNNLFEGLSKIPYLTPYPSQANYIFCKVTGRSSRQLAIDLCNEFSILIKDCSKKLHPDSEFIRVAVRDSFDNRHLLKSLESLI